MGGSKESRCAKCLYSWRPGPHQRVIYVTALPVPSLDAHGSMDHWMCTVTVPEDPEDPEDQEEYEEDRDDGGDERERSSGKCASVRLWVPVNSLSDFLFELDSQWMPGTPRGQNTPRTPQTRSTPRTPRASHTPKTPLGSASLLSPSPSPAPHASCTTDQTQVGSSKAIRLVKVVGKADKTVKAVKAVKALPSSLQRRAVDGDRKRRTEDGDIGGDGVGDDDDDEDVDKRGNDGGVSRVGGEGNGEGEDALYQRVEVTEKTNAATVVKHRSPGSGQGQWNDSGGGVDAPTSGAPGGDRSANLDVSTGSVSEGARLHTSVRSMYV